MPELSRTETPAPCLPELRILPRSLDHYSERILSPLERTTEDWEYRSQRRVPEARSVTVVNANVARIRIAVDAMGGDFAPRSVVAGALDALRSTGNRFEVLLVGPEATVRNELKQQQGNGLAYQVIDAAQVIDMHDPATAGVKQKRNSSISVGVTLHREGAAQAFVSAGHSGAVMSTATMILGRIEGIIRPTIGAFFPSERGVCLLVDA